MKQLTLLLLCFLANSAFAQLQDLGTAIPHSSYHQFNPNPNNGGPNKFSSSPKHCGVDTLQYAYYKGFSGPDYPSLGISNGYSVGQYFDAPVDISISGVTFYAYGSFNTNDSVTVTVNLYAAGSDTLPSGSPIRTAQIVVDSSRNPISFDRIRKMVTFSSPYVADHPYIITLESSDSNIVGVVANSWSAGEGEGENIACATVGGTWYNCMNLNVGGTTLDCDFLIEPHVEYEIYADFTFDNCFTPGDSMQFINESSPVLTHRMYNRLFLNDLMGYSFGYRFGDNTSSFNEIDPKHVYYNAQNYQVSLITTSYRFTNYTSCRDTASYIVNFLPSEPNFKVDTPICSGNVANVDASSTGVVRWYSNFSDTNLIYQGNLYTTDTLYNNKLLFAGGENGECKSARSAIMVNVATSPDDPTVINDSICLNAKANLQAYSNAGTVMWWDDSIAGMPVYFGNVYQTDTLNASLTLYAQSNNRGCLSKNRIPVRANVNANNAPTAPLIPADTSVCLYDDPFYFKAVASGSNQVQWFAQASGGTPFLTSDSLLYSPDVEGVQSIYIQSFDGQCASSRIGFDVTIESFPEKVIGSRDTLCLGDTAFFDYSATPGKVRWYDDEFAGNLIYDSTVIALTGLTQTTVYYLEPYLGNCRDTVRHEVLIDIVPFGEITSKTEDEICSGQMANLSASADAGTILWSETPSMSPILSTGSSYQTVPLNSSKIYYLATLNYKCQSQSTPISAIVNQKPSAGFNYQVSTPGNFDFQANGSNLTYNWDMGDGNTRSSRSFKYTYTEDGVYTVTLITTNNEGCSDTSERTITVSGLASIASIEQFDILVYPNPASSSVNIYNSGAQTALSIIDVHGKLVDSQLLQPDMNIIDISGLNSGVYQLLLKRGDDHFVTRLVVQ
ncbi:T9SS type A sorting domain-containing protein [bacterium]|nr:T9SS type A sorting domain-containing protein [bacterium]